ncbi:MAG: redoxin domain-containing protein [Candidatus Thiodiazotropha sp. (ex Monitilora ramsayi)]|nr:redoxin domain-containing protein [Candidatus Thiodiazotropha sp. (ex Monitilora ramsayi)]
MHIFRFVFFSLLVSLGGCSADTPQEENRIGESAAPEVLNAEFAPGLPWLNVERPLTFKDLNGKVVILDFWTYGCINCIHVLADLKKLEKKYGDQLLVIGVHTPKFDNEKNLETLRSIAIRYGVDHPIVNDIDSLLARYYGMRAWPTRVIIDPAGEVLGKVTGEGRYDLFDQKIAELLETHKAILNPAPIPIKLEREGASTSLLAAPGKITVSNEYIAISDSLHNRILLSDHQGNILHVIGGETAGSQDGEFHLAKFDTPQGLVFSEKGIYVADTGNHQIRYIDLTKETVTTVAGDGTLERKRSGSFDALSIGLASPWGLAIEKDQLYIAMAGSHQIWLFDTTTKKIGPYAGSGHEGIDDGSLERSTFSQPSGLSIQGDWLYVADSEDSAVRRIHRRDLHVETVVGTGLFDFGDRDGTLDQAKLQHVLGIAAVDENRLLIADTYNHKIKSIDLKEGSVETILGDGKPGILSTVDGQLLLNEPGGLTILNDKVLVADTNNNRIVSYDLSTKQAEVLAFKAGR